ncbi:class I adenylate-forming enzyme family protein [Bordetella genomosp. 4]|uniref:Acetyl-CoA synthetase n=1 Tax=Bordetella genomosp. 4 TaxID=463044 RepID=A0A261TLF7_9BORD|nr:class I adenylate-forming enzyme family protein [Bordetella genomosp. 4]OZI42932.1 acetyl-CoA synthetase [Bordetella genomosp. 4]OZI50496.1 acetyl-CoA synthetase [Bordetella genomosp. 4]
MTTLKNLGDLIDPKADPQQIALIGLDGKAGTPETARQYTYAEVDDLARGVAQALLSQGFQTGDRIAILAANSVPYIATVLGIMRAGLIAVPVNFKFPPALIEYVLQDSGARLVLHDQARATAIPDHIPRIALDTPEFDAWRAEGSTPSYTPGDDDTALMLYTSGSTGKPKGVRLSHAGQWWTVDTRRKATPLASERALIAAPLYHMNALALAFLSLASHATTVLLPQFTAAAYIDAIGTYRCTWLTAVPPMIAMMLRERDLLARIDLSSVKVIRMGSAPVSASLLTQIHAMFPAARVINAYGTTEGGPVVFGPHPAGLPTPTMSVGYPHPLVSVQLQPGPGDGPEQGILTLRSPGLMQGYHQRPDLALPFTADGHYITGDVFRRDADGFYYFVGRRDDMFVSGGENIYPGEVEKMLEQHPAVQQAAVVPVDDDIKGTKPVAFIVLRAGQHADAEQIRQYALANAPAYQHPRQVWFVDALPLASTNKIDRHQLLAEAARRLSLDPQHAD